MQCTFPWWYTGKICWKLIGLQGGARRNLLKYRNPEFKIFLTEFLFKNLLSSKSSHNNLGVSLLSAAYDSKRSTLDKSHNDTAAVQSKPVKVEDNQTQQQRQAAAKLALRKQLEKTLLQVIINNFYMLNNFSLNF